MKLYGIPNCDTVKKAKVHLENKNIDYEFVDFKKNPPTKKLIKEVQLFLGELPVNRRGTTFRKIKDIYEEASEKEKIEILIVNSSSIKRPILVKDEKICAVGYDVNEYDRIL